MNNSGRNPHGPRVMVRMQKVAVKNDSGDYCEVGTSFLIPRDQWEKRQMNQVVGQIVEMGADAFHDYKDPYKVGDFIIIKRYSGIHIEGVDNEAYRCILDIDTVCKTVNGDDVETI